MTLYNMIKINQRIQYKILSLTHGRRSRGDGGDPGTCPPLIIYQGEHKRIRPPVFLNILIHIAQVPVEVYYNHRVYLSIIFASAAQPKQLFQF